MIGHAEAIAIAKSANYFLPTNPSSKFLSALITSQKNPISNDIVHVMSLNAI